MTAREQSSDLPALRGQRTLALACLGFSLAVSTALVAGNLGDRSAPLTELRPQLAAHQRLWDDVERVRVQNQEALQHVREALAQLKKTVQPSKP